MYLGVFSAVGFILLANDVLWSERKIKFIQMHSNYLIHLSLAMKKIVIPNLVPIGLFQTWREQSHGCPNKEWILLVPFKFCFF